MNNSYDKAAEFLEKWSSFLIVSHIQPDSDSIGSSAALCHFLNRTGKKAAMLVPDILPKKFNFMTDSLPFYDVDSADEAIGNGYDALVILDCSSWSRLGALENRLKDHFDNVLVIDHHATNCDFGAASVIDPESPATAFLIYNLITRGIGKDIVPFEANAMMAGLKADTGSFSYSNTSKDVFTVAGLLLEAGCSLSTVNSNVGDTWNLETIGFVREALNEIALYENGKIVTIAIPYALFQKYNADRMTAISLMGYIRGFEGVTVSILLYEDEPQLVKSSLRSDGSVDVSKIAASFNGGGHVCASGLLFKGPLTEALAAITEKVREALPSS